MALFKSAPLKFILLSGLLVGTLDILAAFTDYAITVKGNPFIILKYIASAAFGRKAISGGPDMALAGLLFHFTIAMLFTFFFFGLYANTNFLAKNRLLSGVLYAVFIWVVMNEIVIPMSRAPYLQLSFAAMNKVIKAIVILIFSMGLPLSFLGYHIFSKQKKVKWHID